MVLSVSAIIYYSSPQKVDQNLTWGMATRLDSEPCISATGDAITVAITAARAISSSFMVSNFGTIAGK